MWYVITISNYTITGSQGIHLPVVREVDGGGKAAGLDGTVYWNFFA
jgi:hypothetical protein